MSNIATTIEQSKHLLELGLSKETADMSYSEEYFGKDKDGNDEWCWQLNACKFVDVEGIIPAWSLSALLEVMPGDVKVDGEQYYHHLEKNNGFYTVSYYFDDVDELYTLNTTKVCETPLDAAYEMVCWLLEQGLIEKGGQDESES